MSRPTASARRWPAAVLAALLVFVTWLLTGPVVRAAGPPTTAAATSAGIGPAVDLGEVIPIDPAERTSALAGGVSATQFELQLPADASCPGDSLHDQWRVQSFIIPVAGDPGAIAYGVNGPEGKNQYALYELNTSPYTDILTRANSTAGAPGAVNAVPALSFAVFPPGTLPTGRYRMGIACTFFRETAQYWDTEVDLTATPDDEPGQMIWRLVDPPANATLAGAADEDSTSWMLPAAAGTTVVALAGAFWWRSRRRPTPRPKESK